MNNAWTRLRQVPSRGRHITSSSCSLFRSLSSSLPPLLSVSPGNKQKSSLWIPNVVCMTWWQNARRPIFIVHIQVSSQAFTRIFVVMTFLHSSSAVRHHQSACLSLSLSAFGLTLLRWRILDLQLGAESLQLIRRSTIARNVQGWENTLEWKVKHKALKLINICYFSSSNLVQYCSFWFYLM